MDLGNMTLEEIINLNPELEKRLKLLALKQDLDDSSLKVNIETGEENPNFVYDSPKKSSNQNTLLPSVEVREVE
jgi:hypothetical protein